MPPVNRHWAHLTGEVDLANRYVSTLAITTEIPSTDTQQGGKEVECSGVLVGQRLVLTAGHCVCASKKTSSPEGEEKLIIDRSTCAGTAIAATIHYDGQPGDDAAYRVREQHGVVRPHPDLKVVLGAQGMVVSRTADLAVIVLDRPAKLASPVALAEEEVTPGEPVVLVGNGATDTDTSKRRFNKSRIAKGEGCTLLLEQSSSPRYRDDSGGPVLRESGSAQVLVGISGRRLGTQWAATSTHCHRDWLRDELLRAAQSESTPTP